MVTKKAVGLIAVIIVVCASAGVSAIILMASPPQSPQTPTGELDFSVSGASGCLRFLNSSVPVFYVPFTVAPNTNWTLTIDATEMPGGVNGWTDVYIYHGYWDGGANHTCQAADLYPIISDIKSADAEIRADQPFTETFGTTTTQESYTVFYIVPPGGPATFHVTLKPA